MCTVYEFPTKVKLPRELEEGLHDLAEEYVELLADSLEYMATKHTSDEEIDKFMDSVINVFTDGVIKAVDKL